MFPLLVFCPSVRLFVDPITQKIPTQWASKFTCTLYMASIRTLFILKHQASKFHVQLAEKPAKMADLDISSMPTLTQNEIKGQTTLESTWNTAYNT